MRLALVLLNRLRPPGGADLLPTRCRPWPPLARLERARQARHDGLSPGRGVQDPAPAPDHAVAVLHGVKTAWPPCASSASILAKTFQPFVFLLIIVLIVVFMVTSAKT